LLAAARAQVYVSSYPDVMMKVYAQSQVNVVFFVAYLSVEYYFLMNLVGSGLAPHYIYRHLQLLAVVYDAFARSEKDKFRKLLLRRRQACRRAFKLISTSDTIPTASVDRVIGVMHEFEPKQGEPQSGCAISSA
jgi:hypothetical protein